jgi:predicted FMN-binding regulatory protein PaiB
MTSKDAAILHTHYTQDNDYVRIVRQGDSLAIEFQSVDALGNEIWVAVRPPHHPRQRAAWDAMAEYIMST